MNPHGRLALITLDYPPETGGVARYLSNIVKHADHQVDVFVNLTHAAQGPGRVEPVELLHSGRWSWKPSIGFMRSLKGRGYSNIVVSHLLPLGTAAWIARRMGGLPYAVIVHGLDLRLAAAHPRKAWLARRVLKGAGIVIANSEHTAREIRAFVPGVVPRVITPGVEIGEHSSQSEARRRLALSTEAPLILAVARLVPRKGLDRLIEAMSSLPPEVHLAIVGDGSDRERLQEMARPLAERVRFVTQASDLDRDDWYSAADIFALPVREEGGDVEGFGIVFLEAAIHGLPAVAGRSGGAVEAILDGRTGLLVDPNEVEAIALALKFLLADPDRRIQMGRAAKERAASDFRWEDRARMFLELFKK